MCCKPELQGCVRIDLDTHPVLRDVDGLRKEVGGHVGNESLALNDRVLLELNTLDGLVRAEHHVLGIGGQVPL